MNYYANFLQKFQTIKEILCFLVKPIKILKRRRLRQLWSLLSVCRSSTISLIKIQSQFFQFEWFAHFAVDELKFKNKNFVCCKFCCFYFFYLLKLLIQFVCLLQSNIYSKNVNSILLILFFARGLKRFDLQLAKCSRFILLFIFGSKKAQFYR